MPGQISNASSAVGTVTILNGNLAEGKTIISRFISTNTVATIYAITPNTTFYVMEVGLSIHSSVDKTLGYINTSIAGTLMMAHLYAAITPTYHTKDQASMAVTFPHPLPIVVGAGGASINIHSSNVALTADGYVIGWEE